MDGVDPSGERAILERIMRLEESLAFAERTAESLGAEVLSLGEQVRALAARLAALERAARVTEPDDEAASQD